MVLTLGKINELRRSHHKSVLLYLTDRCPVGCEHCSVDALRTSPTVSDYHLLGRILDGLCEAPGLRLIGISGGEPFVERRGLTQAVSRIREADKQIVVYTSGVWARASVPQWVRTVIGMSDCVFLSTDAQHAAKLSASAFKRAARAIVDEGATLVVQVIRDREMVDAAEGLLSETFGTGWAEHAELSLTRPLTYGRGAGVFTRRTPSIAGSEFGTCEALASPVVRYDGRMTACCNERVITGGGPPILRTDVHSATDVLQVMARWTADALLASIEQVGYGPLTELPELTELRQQEHADICDLCWKALPRFAQDRNRSDGILRSVLLMSGKEA